jgi:hypothetical protein
LGSACPWEHRQRMAEENSKFEEMKNNRKKGGPRHPRKATNCALCGANEACACKFEGTCDYYNVKGHSSLACFAKKKDEGGQRSASVLHAGADVWLDMEGNMCLALFTNTIKPPLKGIIPDGWMDWLLDSGAAHLVGCKEKTELRKDAEPFKAKIGTCSAGESLSTEARRTLALTMDSGLSMARNCHFRERTDPQRHWHYSPGPQSWYLYPLSWR